MSDSLMTVGDAVVRLAQMEALFADGLTHGFDESDVCAIRTVLAALTAGAAEVAVRENAELVVEAFFDIGPNNRAFENCIADLRAALASPTPETTP